MAEYTEVLSRLLSDAAERTRFVADPNAYAAQYEDDVRALLLQLRPSKLERQAECLVSKRLQEILLLLPSTCAKQGARLDSLFHCYAQKYWPTSHRRHIEDAVHFACWLRDGSHPIDSAELAPCELLLGRRHLSVTFARIAGRPALRLMFRWRTRLRELCLCIG